MFVLQFDPVIDARCTAARRRSTGGGPDPTVPMDLSRAVIAVTLDPALTGS
jgi:hypothetical protein